jgi:hypothetical protein
MPVELLFLALSFLLFGAYTHGTWQRGEQYALLVISIKRAVISTAFTD